MKNYLLTGLLLIATLLLAAGCGEDGANEATDVAPEDAAPTAVVDTTPYIPYDNPEIGLAMDMPETWIANDYIGNLTLATSQEIIDGETLADMGDGAFVVFLPIERDVLNFQTGQNLDEGDTGQALVLYRSLLEQEGASFEVVEPPLKLEGPNATYIVVRSNQDGVDLLTLMGAADDNGQVVLISASAQEEVFPQWRPTFEHILSSLVVTRPTVLD